MRTLLRTVAAAIVTLPVLLLGTPAHADTCSLHTEISSTSYPCPDESEYPDDLASPVWYTTSGGPGFNRVQWNFIELLQSGHIYFTNTRPTPDRLYGVGFDSGWVQTGETVDVAGVNKLVLGYHRIYDRDGNYSGDLYIRPCRATCVTD